MHLPAPQREDRLDVLHATIAQHPLGALVTHSNAGITAEHIPFIMHSEISANGTLRGHVGINNPLVEHMNVSPESVELNTLVIFQGPQAYISPSWYPSKVEHGKVVPTWNYVLVHAYGNLQLIEDELWLMEHLEALTFSQESQRAIPWKPSDAPEKFMQRQLKGIVGVEVEVDRFEGKWKVSQNKNAADAMGVVTGLKAAGTEELSAMAALVEDRQP